MINGIYFFQLFGNRTGYAYQYTGNKTDFTEITVEFCAAAGNNLISTVISHVDDHIYICSPVKAESAHFTFFCDIVPPPQPDPVVIPDEQPVT